MNKLENKIHLGTIVPVSSGNKRAIVADLTQHS